MSFTVICCCCHMTVLNLVSKKQHFRKKMILSTSKHYWKIKVSGFTPLIKWEIICHLKPPTTSGTDVICVYKKNLQ